MNNSVHIIIAIVGDNGFIFMLLQEESQMAKHLWINVVRWKILQSRNYIIAMSLFIYVYLKELTNSYFIKKRLRKFTYKIIAVIIKKSYIDLH